MQYNFFLKREQSLDSNFIHKIIACLWSIVATPIIITHAH